MSVLRRVRSAGSALLDQASLHGELLGLEWTQEKSRLRRMASALLLGFACLLGVLGALGALLLSVYWDTPHRVTAVASLVALYGLGAALAWRQFQAHADRSAESFAASRAELAADVQLLRSRM
jgi:uncharacterized membrane protein YqjE